MTPEDMARGSRSIFYGFLIALLLAAAVGTVIGALLVLEGIF